MAGYFEDAEWERSGQSTAEYVTRALDVASSDRVLEIGCGTGRVGRHIARHCAHWTGCDVSDNMLKFARVELQGLHNIDLVKLNGYDLDGIADASHDAIYCSAVFMHLDEWDRFRYIKDALRVLRPGGRAFFDNYNLLGNAGWHFFEENSSVDIAVRPSNVSRSSTPQELMAYMSRAGYRDVRIEEGNLFVTAIGYRPGA